MPVSDFLSVHCFASARSRSAFFSKPECCADLPLRNLIPRLNKPRFAFASAKSAWLCVERGECARWQLLVCWSSSTCRLGERVPATSSRTGLNLSLSLQPVSLSEEIEAAFAAPACQFSTGGRWERWVRRTPGEVVGLALTQLCRRTGCWCGAVCAGGQ